MTWRPSSTRGIKQIFPRATARALALFASLFLSLSASAGDTARGSEGLRVLFIGNSLTYTNDLPVMFERLCARGGVKVDRIESLTRPNYGLPDWWTSRTAIREIETGQWDYVILQQGPSATEGRPYLLDYGRRFSELIRKAGAQPAFYMVWPSSQRLADFPGVADSYRTAARDNDAVVLPVGEAWIAAWSRDPKLGLYGHDGFHPSRLGTYLAGLVMYAQLTGNDPRKLPPAIPGLRKDDPLDPQRAQDLQDAAVDAGAGRVR